MILKVSLTENLAPRGTCACNGVLCDHLGQVCGESASYCLHISIKAEGVGVGGACEKCTGPMRRFMDQDPDVTYTLHTHHSDADWDECVAKVLGR